MFTQPGSFSVFFLPVQDGAVLQSSVFLLSKATVPLTQLSPTCTLGVTEQGQTCPQEHRCQKATAGSEGQGCFHFAPLTLFNDSSYCIDTVNICYFLNLSAACAALKMVNFTPAVGPARLLPAVAGFPMCQQNGCAGCW